MESTTNDTASGDGQSQETSERQVTCACGCGEHWHAKGIRDGTGRWFTNPQHKANHTMKESKE